MKVFELIKLFVLVAVLTVKSPLQVMLKSRFLRLATVRLIYTPAVHPEGHTPEIYKDSKAYESYVSVTTVYVPA